MALTFLVVDDSLTMRYFVRMKGWYPPITLSRVRDEETGIVLFEKEKPVEQVAA